MSILWSHSLLNEPRRSFRSRKKNVVNPFKSLKENDLLNFADSRSVSEQESCLSLQVIIYENEV